MTVARLRDKLAKKQKELDAANEKVHVVQAEYNEQTEAVKAMRKEQITKLESQLQEAKFQLDVKMQELEQQAQQFHSIKSRLQSQI